MDYMFYLNLYLLVCSLIGFIYGAVKFFRRSQPLYVQFIACAIGSNMFHRLYVTVMYATEGMEMYDFNVGQLALRSCFLFLFAVNFGVVDRIIDDKNPKNRRYRLLAWIAPVVILAGYIPIYLSQATVVYKAINAVLVIFIAMASYYHLKHLIFPDVKSGIADGLRGFNITALLFAVLSMAEITLSIPENKVYLIPIMIAEGIIYLIMMPVLKKGVMKWKT